MRPAEREKEREREGKASTHRVEKLYVEESRRR